MTLKNDSKKPSKTKYSFIRKAGRSIIDHSPVFSPDGESLIVIVENILRVYNIQTGDCTRILETETPVKQIVAIQFLDDNIYNLYGCSDCGVITTWTWENGAVLRETKLADFLQNKLLTFNVLDENECFVTVASKDCRNILRWLFSMKTGELLYEYKDTWSYYYEGMVNVAVGWCNGDRFAAIVNGTPTMSIQNLTQPHIKQFITNSNKVRFLSVATHKTENVMAATDALGRTLVFRGNFFEYGNNLSREILHWHHLPAMAVSFSVQGSYLYSGGIEKVLVKWTLGSLGNMVNEKMFIPRLPGMIRHIVANNTHVAAALTNNSIVISNVQMNVVSTILECGGLSPAARALGFPLIYHRRLNGLILGGRTGHLQVYSSATDKVLFNVDITGMNNIPPQRHDLIPLDTEVTCAAISANGTWLVTSEYRNDGITYPEERLKFWFLQIKNTTPFQLSTCVNLSHGGCRVVAITLNLTAQICVTAGADQKFRVWKRKTNREPHNNVQYWTCVTACYYSSGVAHSLSHGILNNYKFGRLPEPSDFKFPYMFEFQRRDDIIRKVMNIHKERKILDEGEIDKGMKKNDDTDMGGVALSQDGSLIAAWFGSKLTLWDTYLCNLKTTLSHPALRPKGIHVKFGSKDAAHYLACTTETCVAVWSLLSLTVKWLVPISATCLAAHPFSNKMAVVSSSNDVYVFTPHSSQPIFVRKHLISAKTGVFKECTFGHCTGDDIRLFLVRNDAEIFSLEPEQSESSRLKVISRRNLPASNFSALVAEQQLSEVRPAMHGDVTALDSEALASGALAQFLSAAPHMIPPVSLLCTSFLHHIAGHKQEEPSPDNEESMEVDQPSEDEEELPQNSKPHAPKPTQLWAPNYEKIKEKRLQKIIKEPLLDLHETSNIFGV